MTPTTQQKYRGECGHKATIGMGGFCVISESCGLLAVCPKCGNTTTIEIMKPPSRRPPNKDGSRLNRVSAKRKALNAAVGPERRKRKAETGCCMVCREPFPPSELDADEIARGVGREKCLEYPELQLISCRRCHQKTQHWPPAKRLALLFAFKMDYACGKYCEIMGYASTHLTRESVLTYLERSRDVNGVSPAMKVKVKK